MKYLALAVVLSTCPAIDPGSCRPHADEQPFDGGQHIMIEKRELTATAVVTSSCSWCGKAAQ